MKNSILVILAVTMLASCARTQTQKKEESAVIHLDAAGFQKRADAGNGIVLDVRTPEEVAAGHIKNATVMDFYEADFKEQLKTLPKDKEIYVYCARGRRSADAANILLENGYEKVYNLKEGFTDWEAKGFPVEKE